MQQEHFLRPTFTRFLIERLKKGESLNLYGHQGIGKSRLLEDINNARLPGVLVICVSFQDYQQSYSDFHKTIQLAAGINSSQTKRFDQLIKQLSVCGQHIFLLIDDFKYFNNNLQLDPGYNVLFIETLCEIKDIPGISLLLVTEEPFDSVTSHIDQRRLVSQLNLENIKLQALKALDIRREIERLKISRALKEGEIKELVAYLLTVPDNYAFLKAIHPKLLTGDAKARAFNRRLKHWRNEFNQSNKNSLNKKLIIFDSWIKRWPIILKPLRIIYHLIKNR